MISYLLLGEKTSLLVGLSLVPVMSGLALCSFYEIEFNLTGFLAAMGANFTECLQNVYSKLLISGGSAGQSGRCTPAQLQFYTSLASMIIQIPTAWILVENLDFHLFPWFVLNGVFFHFQSITAYVLMDYISPVTHRWLFLIGIIFWWLIVVIILQRCQHDEARPSNIAIFIFIQ